MILQEVDVKKEEVGWLVGWLPEKRHPARPRVVSPSSSQRPTEKSPDSLRPAGAADLPRPREGPDEGPPACNLSDLLNEKLEMHSSLRRCILLHFLSYFVRFCCSYSSQIPSFLSIACARKKSLLACRGLRRDGHLRLRLRPPPPAPEKSLFEKIEWSPEVDNVFSR